MSNADEQPPTESATPDDESRDESMRKLLRAAFQESAQPNEDVLRAVQRKIRQRSRGKFYADRWSTAKQPPILTYLVTSIIMLAIVVFLYALFGSLRGRAERIDATPPPVQVLPPTR